MAVIVLFVVAAFLVAHGFCHITQRQIEEQKCYNNICWYQDDYPLDKIRQSLENENNFQTFGDNDNVNTDSEAVALENEPSCSLCEYLVNLKVSPTVVKDMDEVYYVVKTKYYNPVIVFKICHPESQQYKSACLQLGDKLHKNTTCDQKSTMIMLLVYDPKDNKFKNKSVQYDSGCVCTIQKNILEIS